MFREKMSLNDVRVSHDLSGRINTKRNDKPAGLGRETRLDAKVEMRYAG